MSPARSYVLIVTLSRDPAVDQLQRAGADAVTEEPFAGADHHGEYPEPVLVENYIGGFRRPLIARRS